MTLKELGAEIILYVALLYPIWEVMPERIEKLYQNVWLHQLNRVLIFGYRLGLYNPDKDSKYDHWHIYRLMYYRSRSLYK